MKKIRRTAVASAAVMVFLIAIACNPDESQRDGFVFGFNRTSGPYLEASHTGETLELKLKKDCPSQQGFDNFTKTFYEKGLAPAMPQIKSAGFRTITLHCQSFSTNWPVP